MLLGAGVRHTVSQACCALKDLMITTLSARQHTCSNTLSARQHTCQQHRQPADYPPAAATHAGLCRRTAAPRCCPSACPAPARTRQCPVARPPAPPAAPPPPPLPSVTCWVPWLASASGQVGRCLPECAAEWLYAVSAVWLLSVVTTTALLHYCTTPALCSSSLQSVLPSWPVGVLAQRHALSSSAASKPQVCTCPWPEAAGTGGLQQCPFWSKSLPHPSTAGSWPE